MRKAKILVVDDDRLVSWALEEKLSKEGFDVHSKEKGEEALDELRRSIPDLALVDIFLPDISGIQILKEIRSINGDVPVIMITGSEMIDTAVTAMKLGAYDYIHKPFNLNEVVLTVRKALESKTMIQEISWRVEKEKKDHGIDNVVGESPQMEETVRMVRKVAQSEATTVLIEGESGTGKDLIAKAIHYSGPRSRKPFMDINCTAMQETLVESELFGHEKGAFTDAKSLKTGLFELADGGSVLLDEIGDTSPSTQAKLLKLIENKRFKRVGGTEDIEVDVRIIAATNQNLKERVKSGEFREDLYYRLKVIPIYVEPLRARREDILPLCRHFIGNFNVDFKKRVKGLSPKAEKALLNYHWPGNVREVRNVIERAIILGGEEEIKIEHLPTEVLQQEPTNEMRENLFSLPDEGISLEAVENDLLMQALKRTNGNQSKAAHLLGLTRFALRYRMKKIGLLK